MLMYFFSISGMRANPCEGLIFIFRRYNKILLFSYTIDYLYRDGHVISVEKEGGKILTCLPELNGSPHPDYVSCRWSSNSNGEYYDCSLHTFQSMMLGIFHNINIYRK